ncbi:hypothetical protein BCR33DRAFT_132084 [Rhizoclosmatium globosum]|uniref:Uncharacterized protein n=1 Tax=Rhizoclosmatium globosum TaxID=329046 RepID=A0A1Y2CHU5_9FUNG|nr:hypothetical protein BCR33DRAFT_132084 [Rhizoclosmatium globosum]|eukprot:ORY46609.1 hypothetical protein BCR33DRAFT_132084 [Rhizoclosmatium globosum]
MGVLTADLDTATNANTVAQLEASDIKVALERVNEECMASKALAEERAESFNQLKTEYDAASLRLASLTEELESAKSYIAQQSAQVNAEAGNVSERLQALTEELDGAKSLIEQQSCQLEQAQHDYAEANAQLISLREELETVKNSYNEQSQEMEKRNQELLCERERMESAVREIGLRMRCWWRWRINLRRLANKLRRLLNLLKRHMVTLMFVLEAQKHALLAREEFERSQALVAERESHVTALESALAVMTKERDEMKREWNAVRDKLTGMQTNLDVSEESFLDLEAALRDSKAREGVLQAQVQEATRLLGESQAALEQRWLRLGNGSGELGIGDADVWRCWFAIASCCRCSRRSQSC